MLSFSPWHVIGRDLHVCVVARCYINPITAPAAQATRLGLAYGNLVELARGLPDDGRVCSSMGSASIPTHDEMSEHGPCQYPNSCCSPSPMVAACAALRELAVPLSGSARLVTAEKGVCSGRRNRFIGRPRRSGSTGSLGRPEKEISFFGRLPKKEVELFPF